MISPCTDFQRFYLFGAVKLQVLASGNASSWCDRILAPAKQKLPWRLVSQRFVGALGRPLEVMLWPLGLKKWIDRGSPGSPASTFAAESTFAAWEPHEVISSWCFPSPKGEKHSFKLLTIHGIKHDVFVWREWERQLRSSVLWCLCCRASWRRKLWRDFMLPLTWWSRTFAARGWCLRPPWVGIDSSWQWTPHVSRKSLSKLEISHC